MRVEQDLSDIGYYTCQEGTGLEAPAQSTYPLNADGKLRVTDIHGGVGSQTVIVMRACFEVGCEQLVYILVSWDHPGTRFDDYLGDDVHLAPEDVYYRAVRVESQRGIDEGIVPVRIVEWVSSDIGIPGQAGPSPRFVDAGDLAYFSTLLGDPIRWGFAPGGGEDPANSPTFQCDVNPFDSSPTIASGDLAIFVNRVGTSCQLGKVGAGTEFAAILDWFGIAQSGRLVVVGPNGETFPEYEVVDEEKNRRAIVDPYGYLDTMNSNAVAERVPWSLVKQFFR